MSAVALARTPGGRAVHAVRATRGHSPLTPPRLVMEGSLRDAVPSPVGSPKVGSPKASSPVPSPQSVRRRRGVRDELAMSLQTGHTANGRSGSRPATPDAGTPKARGRQVPPAAASGRSESEGPGRARGPVEVARRGVSVPRPLPREPAAFGPNTAGKSFDTATMHRLMRSHDQFLIGPLRGAHGPTATGDPNSAHALHHDAFTVVFDLDETLAANRGPGKAQLRPGAVELLASLAALSTPQRPVEIVLWTASIESLARPVVDRLDPARRCFTHFVFRDRRWFRETGYTKDLRLLGRCMDRTAIIENSPMSVNLNPRNAVLVSDFFGHAPRDSELHAVGAVLQGWITADPFVPVWDYFAGHEFMNTGRIVAHRPPPAPVGPRLLSPASMRARPPLWSR